MNINSTEVTNAETANPRFVRVFSTVIRSYLLFSLNPVFCLQITDWNEINLTLGSNFDWTHLNSIPSDVTDAEDKAVVWGVTFRATRSSINKSQHQYITKEVNIVLTALKLYVEKVMSTIRFVFKLFMHCHYHFFISVLVSALLLLFPFAVPSLPLKDYLLRVCGGGSGGGGLDKFKACTRLCACPVCPDMTLSCRWRDAVEMM